jgi:hypothetical protein
MAAAAAHRLARAGREVIYEFESVWTATRVTARGGAVRDLRGLRRILEGR